VHTVRSTPKEIDIDIYVTEAGQHTAARPAEPPRPPLSEPVLRVPVERWQAEPANWRTE
jgi:hypothetical protein